MEFIINEYHRDIPDEDLLEDIRRVADIYSTDALSRSEYNKYGKFGSSTISRRFGSWNNAIKRIGLTANENGQQIHEFCENEEDFFKDLRTIADVLRKQYVTVGEYEQYGKYSRSAMFRKYKSWDTILKKAGLTSTPYRLGKSKSISDEELFHDIERVWIKLGRQPTINDVKNGEFSYSQNTFTRRFGGWRGTLEAFVKYINSDDTEVSNDTTDEDKDINSHNEMRHHTINTNTKREPNTSNRLNEVKDTDNHSGDEIPHFRHKTKREPSNRLKVQVLMRDGNRCRICGVACNDGIHKINFDHIKPWSKGGETTLENLQVLCSVCNDALGNLDK